MKKNKTIAYMLAATLLVGGTFVGTKAWFTASGTVDSGLVVTTGSMGLSVTEDNNWEVVTPGGITEITNQGAGNNFENVTPAGDRTEITNQGAKNNFENVKPGDDFEKQVTIKNTGSLNQVLTVTGGNINNNLNKNFTVSFKTQNNEEIENITDFIGTNLAPSDSKTFKIVVETVENEMSSDDADITNDGENGLDDEAREFNLKGVMGQITINAKQTNDK